MLDQLESEKEYLESKQVAYALTDDFPLTQNLNINKAEYPLLAHVVAKVTSMLDIKITSRESSTYLHSHTFYSLYLDMFDGPNGLGYIHSSWSNSIKM